MKSLFSLILTFLSCPCDWLAFSESEWRWGRREKGPLTGLLESLPFGRCLLGVLMGTLVDSQKPWLCTQADLLRHSWLLPWLSVLEPFTEGSGPAGFCSIPLAHRTLPNSCLSNGQAVVYQVLPPGLSVLCLYPTSRLLQTSLMIMNATKRVPCCPRSPPTVIGPSPKIALDSVIPHLCEDMVRYKCWPQLLPGASNLCKCFSWQHSSLQDIWVMKGQS